MTIKKIKTIRRLSIISIFIASFVFVIAFIIYYFVTTPTIFDRPSGLTEEIKTIEVSYINWACDCPDFIETKYYKNNFSYKSKEEDCIFIESANPSINVPDNFYSKGHFEKHLRLTGQFYKKIGIPKAYKQKTSEKPDKANVFRYYKIEIIEK